MKKHLYEVIPVTFVVRSSRLNGTWKNIWKKSTYNILVPNERYQDFWQLLQNHKFPKNILGFSNHAQRFTPPYYLDVDNPFKFLRMVTIWVWVLSQFEFLSFITNWVLEFCHHSSFWVSSQLWVLWVWSQFEFLSYITIWAYKFDHNLSFWVWSQFEFLSFVTVWIFLVLSLFDFLSFITIWFFEFHRKLSFFFI